MYAFRLDGLTVTKKNYPWNRRKRPQLFNNKISYFIGTCCTTQLYCFQGQGPVVCSNVFSANREDLVILSCLLKKEETLSRSYNSK